MKTYAIGVLNDVTIGPPIVDYLERIDATLAPHGGEFIVHGASPTLLEGDHPGDVVIIAFPDRASARNWYHSEPYQAIVPLRADNSTSQILLVDGVDPGHLAPDILSASGPGQS